MCSCVKPHSVQEIKVNETNVKMIPGRALSALTISNFRCNSATTIQFYSVFPPNYIKPIYKKDEQQEIYERPESKKLAHVPIKPAFSSDTASEFHDPLVRKFTNYVMRKGKKMLARKLVEETFENVKIMQLQKYYDAPPEQRETIVLDPKEIFHRAVENCIPVLELQRIRRGGIAYQVPVPMNDNRAKFLSMNWLIQTAQEKGNAEKFPDVLAKELIAAAKNEGRVIKKKQDLHKQCEANRAYAHYRWL